MQMKIAIVEDEQTAAKALEEFLLHYAKTHGMTFRIDCYGGIMDFLEPYRGYELAFLDIRMPGINGMDGAKQLRRLDREVRLVFVTSMAQYAIRGYTVEASDFILKPITYAALSFCMDRLLPAMELRNRQGNSLLIRQSGGFIRISVREIAFAEVSGHTLRYHLSDGEICETRGKLSETEPQLAAAGFLRCHNSYLVNPEHIDGMEGYELRIKGNLVPISHPRRKAFLEELTRYYAGGGR